MAVYMILEIEVTDPETYATYVERAPATVAEYGGRYLVRCGAVTPLIGDWRPERLVVLEFATMGDYQRWVTSPEYSAIAPLRERSTKGRAIVVEGYEGAS